MKAIQLHDKYTEEIIGTVLTQDHLYDDVCKAWDKYQKYHNSNSDIDKEPCIYDFVSKGNYELCEVLDIDFYQPS